MNLELFLAKGLSKSRLSQNHYSGPIIQISSLVICISLIIIIMSQVIGEGLKDTIEKNIKIVEPDILISNINYRQESEFISLTTKQKESITNITSITNIEPVIKKTAVIIKDQNIKGVILKGINEDYRNKMIKDFLIEGNYFDKDNNENQIIISSIQSKKLQLKVGEKCLLNFVSKNKNIQKRKFHIIGIYDMKVASFNENYCFVQNKKLQKINNWQVNEFSNFEITLSDLKTVNEITNEVNKNLNYNLIATSIKERFKTIFNWIKLFEKNIFFIIMIMSTICIINMTNTLLILILERLKMIGTLKSFGCSDFSILKIFLYNSFQISKKALIIANVITIFFCYIQKTTHFIKLDINSYFVNHLPIKLDFLSIFTINILTFLIIQISIIIPYYMIKKLSTTEILKIK